MTASTLFFFLLEAQEALIHLFYMTAIYTWRSGLFESLLLCFSVIHLACLAVMFAQALRTVQGDSTKARTRRLTVAHVGHQNNPPLLQVAHINSFSSK